MEDMIYFISSVATISHPNPFFEMLLYCCYFVVAKLGFIF